MRFRDYIIESKIRLKRNGPGNYYADIGRIYINAWQTEGSNKYWGAEVELGKYGDDDYKYENVHAKTKKELMGYLETIIKKLGKK